MLVPLDQITDALRRIEPCVLRTPVVRSRYYSGLLGVDVYLKLEVLQPTHAFKVRGAFNALLCLPDERRARGVICASGGNHGLGVALAARTLGIPATVYLPQSTSPLKVAAIRDLGAEAIITGAAWDEANREALAASSREDRPYIHAFDDVNVMAGQGTMMLELAEQLPVRPELVVASIGGGGLLSGVVSAARQMPFFEGTRILGVETEGADSMTRSVRAGQIVELPAITSIADSLGAKKTGPRQFSILSEYADEFATVPDAETVREIVTLLNEEKLLLEPATACSFVALRRQQVSVGPVAVIVCGGNISLEQLIAWRERFGV
ncbi:MAG: threonine/serine dehydratase [Anaerolineae bacterium]|nr:threonine/serine dehydratase [Anaerolineae bacterium]